MLATVRTLLPFSWPNRAATESSYAYALADLGEDENGAPFLPVALNDAGDLAVAAHGVDGLVRGTVLRGGERSPAGEAMAHEPARCLNRLGQVAGIVGASVREWRAWAAHLGAFGEKHWPGVMSDARGINARGDLVGNVTFDAGEVGLSRAFLRTAAGSVRLLTAPHGGTAVATAINDRGDITVNSTPLGAARHDSHAWLLRENCYIAIQGLGGRRAWANGLTPESRVFGRALTAKHTTHAFLWDDGAVTDLGTLDDGESEALGANDQLTVVGRAVTRDGMRSAFRWTPTEGMKRLDDLANLPAGWTLREAVAINARGVIAGIALARGRRRGFLLTPTEAS
jgi:probable HAF family extracellular repeat protein